MTDALRARLDRQNTHEYRKNRRDVALNGFKGVNCVSDFLDKFMRITDIERPVIHDDDEFGFCIGISSIIPSPNGNISPNYYRLFTDGFELTRDKIRESMRNTQDEEKLEYGAAMLACLDRCSEICAEHRELAKSKGCNKLYNALLKIPEKPAESFYEALVFIRLCVYFLRVGFGSHLGFGRFDRQMYPLYKRERARGVSDEEIFDMLEAFFVSLNYDSDVYQGIQQGDNGQSMVLGGFDADGNSMYNELSDMCMRASLELDLIDPKINLRVGRNTPIELYELGTQLTRRGLGFPQYCNDDVVIPGLIKLGYDPADAVNYTVAACWEYIIPHLDGGIHNHATFDFPTVINSVIVRELPACESFDALMARVRRAIRQECDTIVESKNGYRMSPNPLMSIMTDGCIESLTDIWVGAKYRNYGCHGAGISNATDALCAVRRSVFDDKIITPVELIEAMEHNFDGYAEIRNILRACPKMGDNDEYADGIAGELMSEFSDALNCRDNGVGGVWRAGTGSAMEYMLKGERCPATADGRLSGEPYSSSFSPSLDVKNTGILSVIQSFTSFDMTRIINGGPLTLEIHDTVLRGDEGVSKVAMLVRTFIMLGGHQLQLNSVNRDRLIDAKAHPEKYPGLIVRVWGWSGYFNELDEKYQNHIIRRVEHTL